MPITTEPYSRFALTKTVLVNGNEVFGRWTMPDILVRDLADYEKTMFTVEKKFEGRPDLISENFYATTKLDWLVIAINNASSAMNWPRAGDVIIIPNVSIAISELL